MNDITSTNDSNQPPARGTARQVTLPFAVRGTVTEPGGRRARGLTVMALDQGLRPPARPPPPGDAPLRGARHGHRARRPPRPRPDRPGVRSGPPPPRGARPGADRTGARRTGRSPRRAARPPPRPRPDRHGVPSGPPPPRGARPRADRRTRRIRDRILRRALHPRRERGGRPGRRGE